MSHIPLDNLLAALSISIHRANEILKESSIDEFSKYFDETHDEEGQVSSYTPTSIPLKVPAGDGSHKVIDVPIVALLHHHAMALENVKVEINLKTVYWEEENEMLAVRVGPLDQEENQPSGISASFVLDFKLNETPEGKSRTYDNFIKHL
ncbi:DUF2589 domain-containing protein [Candidatus Leptofilum sp.]|uniref:DUF2589 domain-containing protein n=1 Tax=Candidatus Leptofilum sp. TaxID=3241576 RepID=UPI003B5948F0